MPYRATSPIFIARLCRSTVYRRQPLHCARVRRRRLATSASAAYDACYLTRGRHRRQSRAWPPITPRALLRGYHAAVRLAAGCRSRRARPRHSRPISRAYAPCAVEVLRSRPLFSLNRPLMPRAVPRVILAPTASLLSTRPIRTRRGRTLKSRVR